MAQHGRRVWPREGEDRPGTQQETAHYDLRMDNMLLQGDRSALVRELKGLREALAPVARLGELLRPEARDETVLHLGSGERGIAITVGHVRHARRVLGLE